MKSFKRQITKAIKESGMDARAFAISGTEFSTDNHINAAIITEKLRRAGVPIELEFSTRSRWDGPKDSFGAIIGNSAYNNHGHAMH